MRRPNVSKREFVFLAGERSLEARILNTSSDVLGSGFLSYRPSMGEG
ncbi:MAG: hypothetical protein KBC96_03055 [Armatimonadetes bacterium]|nr:hypothetical protein [Armatimonadota bacterium]